MPRPVKPRHVCILPDYDAFGPVGIPKRNLQRINLSVDEIETIRLLDYQGYTQAEAAEQMNVARTTIQRIYNEARQKIADFFVNGKMLTIGGGNYTLCDSDDNQCRLPNRLRRRRKGRR